jgi:hypothetical protein
MGKIKKIKAVLEELESLLIVAKEAVEKIKTGKGVKRIEEELKIKTNLSGLKKEIYDYAAAKVKQVVTNFMISGKDKGQVQPAPVADAKVSPSKALVDKREIAPARKKQFEELEKHYKCNKYIY